MLLSVLAALACCFVSASAQTVIQLDSVIGVTGTDAATPGIAGVGNAVNFTGIPSDPGITNLIAAGSPGSSSFNFNTGFSDSIDRAIGSAYGGNHVKVDQRFDGITANLLLLDTNLNGLFDGSEGTTALTGFGMHGDNFITFDLNVIRANAGLAPGTTLYLTGIAGLAVPGAVAPTSAAIITDGSQRAVFDWFDSPGTPGSLSSSFGLTLAGSTRYLTFAALSGQDLDYSWAHVGFANVQVSTVPEPSTWLLIGTGLLGLGLQRWRRRA